MDFTTYQAAVERFFAYPPEMGIAYTALGLAGEAGEVANEVKKIFRDDGGRPKIERRQKIAEELGDVLWYIAALAKELGLSMDDLAERNIEKLCLRYPARAANVQEIIALGRTKL